MRAPGKETHTHTQLSTVALPPTSTAPRNCASLLQTWRGWPLHLGLDGNSLSIFITTLRLLLAGPLGLGLRWCLASTPRGRWALRLSSIDGLSMLSLNRRHSRRVAHAALGANPKIRRKLWLVWGLLRHKGIHRHRIVVRRRPLGVVRQRSSVHGVLMHRLH